MKIQFYILLFSFITISAFSQDIKNSEQIEKQKLKPTFYQFDITIPLRGNETYGEIDNNGNRSDNWFLPDGIGAKFGYGYQPKKWIGISLHSGLDWKATQKIVAIPVYGNLRISPGLGNGTRLTSQIGFGKGFVLGRGNLQGNYAKVSLGIETDEDLILFIEGSNYNINFKGEKSISIISIGFALRTY